MAYTTKYGNYVKFLRGTPTAWKSLVEKDKDTLYFIAEEDADKGELYLGSKLIAGGGTVTSIKDLEGVLLSQDIPTNSLLVYDKSKDAWVNKTADEVFSIIVTPMKGASERDNGTSGLVPQPKAGQQNLFLRGDATWANPTEAVEIEISNLDQKIDTSISELRGVDSTGTIADIATRVTNAAVAKIVAGAPEKFDTLKEIADWIEKNPGAGDVTDLVAKVEQHEDLLNNPTTGLVTVAGNLKEDIHGEKGILNTINTITSTLTSVQGDVTSLNQRVTNNETKISNLENQLKWQDLILAE